MHSPCPQTAESERNNSVILVHMLPKAYFKMMAIFLWRNYLHCSRVWSGCLPRSKGSCKTHRHSRRSYQGKTQINSQEDTMVS